MNLQEFQTAVAAYEKMFPPERYLHAPGRIGPAWASFDCEWKASCPETTGK